MNTFTRHCYLSKHKNAFILQTIHFTRGEDNENSNCNAVFAIGGKLHLHFYQFYHSGPTVGQSEPDNGCNGAIARLTRENNGCNRAIARPSRVDRLCGLC